MEQKLFIMDVLYIVIALIVLILIFYFKEKFIQSKNKSTYLIVFIALIIGATLPFHYVPDQLKVFPKNNLTFSNTFIMQEDIDRIIERYNNTNIFEQRALNNEPLIRKLREEGIIVDKNKN